MTRKSGILMPVFSLPNKYGIGDFGENAYNFIDFLCAAGQKVWQVLPLVQTGFGNSPYFSVCGNSFSPYYISPELLAEEGLIEKEEAEFSLNSSKYVDYGFLYSVRYPMLKKAFFSFDVNKEEFAEFKNCGEYSDYALFMALKNAYGQKPFYEWREEHKKRDKSALKDFAARNKEDIDFWLFLQFQAEKQWKNLKKYANDKGVAILGDLPLYVAADSVDVWKNPEYFLLDENFKPKKVAGVPPDYFSKCGQLWGNPVYDYRNLEKDGFIWWVKRLSAALSSFDFVRIDHFRGLDRFYSVNAGEPTAEKGEWEKVPSEKLFKVLHENVDKSKIIAEDLGIIDDGVKDLLKRTGYPGMKVLEFAFNGEKDNPYLPENVTENSVCYTGTHDNDTLKGYIDSASEWDKNNLIRGVKSSVQKAGLKVDTDSDKDLVGAIINLGMVSKAKIFIMPYQDAIFAGSDYRINAPGTLSEKNWAIRFEDKDFTVETAQLLKALCEKYER